MLTASDYTLDSSMRTAKTIFGTQEVNFLKTSFVHEKNYMYTVVLHFVYSRCVYLWLEIAFTIVV